MSHQIASKIIILLVFLSFAASVFLIHIKFENWTATTIVLVIGGLMVAVCTGLLTPKEAAGKLNNKLPEIKAELN